ncbi:Uncharacterized protein OBRU01_19011 [Operophtera brumata]|uniref:MADF domain-containing protein n=1 Tax=Operophtera brumata TaxID=104452 RepID=A0A0L7KSM2_OPEBR|nr:Uncharacterized protein OBRU01_19011 [Operophtera brumata]
MPRSRFQCFWTRKLELELIYFVRQREAIWKPAGNTNHDIQLKYKAYAEFAAKLGQGFTARSVRDRWVNIRSTFNHNLRKVKRTELAASSHMEAYNIPEYEHLEVRQVKEESELEVGTYKLNVRTDRPRHKKIIKQKKSSKCLKVIDNLIEALNPLLKIAPKPSYWFFGKHVAERLDCMRDVDAESASQEIMRLFNDWTQTDDFT